MEYMKSFYKNIEKTMSYKMCNNCEKPLINEKNLMVFRARVGIGGLGGATVGGVLGAYVLPLMGFGSAGVTKGSLAAWYQGPVIGAGTWFATLQSLGATGLKVVLFKSAGSALGGFGALGILYDSRSDNGWCSCDIVPDAPQSKTVEVMKKSK